MLSFDPLKGPYNLLGSCNVTCMYVTDCLELNNQLVCSLLGRVTSSAPYVTQLPVDFCVKTSCEPLQFFVGPEGQT